MSPRAQSDRPGRKRAVDLFEYVARQEALDTLRKDPEKYLKRLYNTHLRDWMRWERFSTERLDELQPAERVKLTNYLAKLSFRLNRILERLDELAVSVCPAEVVSGFRG
jgi:hypothetical protein